MKYFILITLIFFSAQASAAPFGSDKPAIITASLMTYDRPNEIVTAEGNVEIMQDGNLLFADKVVYNRITDEVMADGNVSLMEKSGNVVFASHVELKDNMKKGVIANIRSRLSDNSVFASNIAIREDKNHMKLEKAVYSPCKLCIDNPSKPPLWQVKAEKVDIDQVAEKISYKNAFMEMFGLPVIYTPFISHPTPDASKQSGILAPSYGSSSLLGAIVSVPYYYNIGPNIDATINPIFTSKEGLVMAGDLRHLTDDGYYFLKGSATYPEKRDALGSITSGSEFRGHIEGKGNFAIDNYWDWGFNVKRATDDTYTLKYKFGDEDYFTSRAYIQKIKDRDYILAETVGFQELRSRNLPGSTPFAAPNIKAHVETAPMRYGSRAFFDFDTLNLTRETGAESRRISGTAGWKIPYVTVAGHVLEFSAKLRGDAYHVENSFNFLDPSIKKDGSAGRIIPEVKASWSLPLVKTTSINNIFLEPTANLILSPHGGNPSKIANEDSQELELSDVNLFDSSRFTGLDRIETGPRVNYGLRGGIYGRNKGSINFLFGQNYHFKEDENFGVQSGLKDNLSDYVGRFILSDGEVFDLAYRFRLDNEEFKMHRNEISIGLNLLPIRFNIDYVTLDDEFSSIINKPSREELFTLATIDFSEQWSLSANSRRDLSEDGGFISTGAGLLFRNECISINAGVNREFIRDREIKPSTSFIMKIIFKNINGTLD